MHWDDYALIFCKLCIIIDKLSCIGWYQSEWPWLSSRVSAEWESKNVCTHFLQPIWMKFVMLLWHVDLFRLMLDVVDMIVYFKGESSTEMVFTKNTFSIGLHMSGYKLIWLENSTVVNMTLLYSLILIRMTDLYPRWEGLYRKLELVQSLNDLDLHSRSVGNMTMGTCAIILL